jgi:hypothetical protein
MHAVQATCVNYSVAVAQVDFQPPSYCSPSPVKLKAFDPMLSEAALCTPRKGVSLCSGRAHSIDLCPRGALQSHSRHLGIVAAALEELGLLAGRLARIPTGPVIGPDCLFGSSQEAQSDGGFYQEAVDICLSGLEDTGSGPCSPGMAQLQFGPEQTGTGITSSPSAHDSEPPTSPLAFVGDDVTEETTLRAGTLSVDEFISSFKLPLPEPILL